MKERNNDQPITYSLPPAWCSSICRNAMNEVCVENCAIERDCSGFEEKPNLKLTDMPRYPKAEGMTKEEKFTSVTVYLSKVVDHLQGVENDYDTYTPSPRRDLHGSGSRRIPENFQIKDLLSDFQEGNSPPEDRAKRADTPDGSSNVDGKTSQAASL